MPDQVPVVPADGAVAAAVDPPLVAAPAPANDKISTKYANDNVVSVFSCPCIRFPSRVFRARRCWSVSLVLASVLLVLVFRVCAISLVFASVYKFTVFASGLLFYFRVCVTILVLGVCVQI